MGAIDSRKIPWGVQWEIARLFSLDKFKWEECDCLMEKLDRLTGANKDHSRRKVAEVLLSKGDLTVGHSEDYQRAFAREIELTDPFPKELDDEDAALANDDYQRLGQGNTSSW